MTIEIKKDRFFLAFWFAPFANARFGRGDVLVTAYKDHGEAEFTVISRLRVYVGDKPTDPDHKQWAHTKADSEQACYRVTMDLMGRLCEVNENESLKVEHVPINSDNPELVSKILLSQEWAHPQGVLPSKGGEA